MRIRGPMERFVPAGGAHGAMALAAVLAVAVVVAACGGGGGGSDRPAGEGAAKETPMVAGVDTTMIRGDVERRLAKFSPTPIEADLSGLSPSDRRVLDKLLDASRRMEEIFARQAWHANPEIRKQLERGGMAASGSGTGSSESGEASVSTAGSGGEPGGGESDPAPGSAAGMGAEAGPGKGGGGKRNAALAYFDISVGPWDRIDEEPFIGDLPRPDGAGFYPPDMGKEEFEAWIQKNPADADAFKGLFTVIVRDGAGLKSVPYSQTYREWLEPAAASLREAAALTGNASLKTFLETRADAFMSDDYYASDVAWMDLDSQIEVTIGPYETYEDRMFGYKAAFESFVTIQDKGASDKLAFYKNELPGMERNLPIPEEYKNPKRGTESPIRVVDVVYTSGDTRAGIQTIAYNLPNDEKVREDKGSKKVLLRNVMDAKFTSILQPIAAKIIAESQQSHVTAEAFFNETLFHELSHGLGPGKIKVDGRDTEVRLELKEHYSALEEAKADVMGAWNILYMIDKGAFPASFRDDLFVTFLAGMFRSVRFGIEEAHGKGVALQYNILKEKGAILLDPATGRFSVDFAKFHAGIEHIVRELCVIQAKGDYQGAVRLLETYAKVPAEWKAALDGIGDIPVDIRPIYTAAGERG